MLSFQFESTFQEEKTENDTKRYNDNCRVTFMPNEDIQDRYILIISKLISSDGIRRVEIAEKELMVIDVRDDVLTFTRDLAELDRVRLFVSIFFRAGSVTQLLLSDYEQDDRLKRQILYLS